MNGKATLLSLEILRLIMDRNSFVSMKMVNSSLPKELVLLHQLISMWLVLDQKYWHWQARECTDGLLGKNSNGFDLKIKSKTDINFNYFKQP